MVEASRRRWPCGVRRLVDEDVTLLGEQLQRLDAEVADRQLDEVTWLDYQRALDAYESDQRTVTRVTSAQEISKSNRRS